MDVSGGVSACGGVSGVLKGVLACGGVSGGVSEGVWGVLGRQRVGCQWEGVSVWGC